MAESGSKPTSSMWSISELGSVADLILRTKAPYLVVDRDAIDVVNAVTAGKAYCLSRASRFGWSYCSCSGKALVTAIVLLTSFIFCFKSMMRQWFTTQPAYWNLL